MGALKATTRPAVLVGRAAATVDLDDAIVRFASAAEGGQALLFAEAKAVFRSLTGARHVGVLVHSGGAWREWDRLDVLDEQETPLDGLPPASLSWDTVNRLGDTVFIPVRLGSVAVLARGTAVDADTVGQLKTAATVLKLALASCEANCGNPDKLEAIKVFQRVANRILKSRDLPEVLLLITHEAKARLSADICGVMLREEDAVVMQRCVGNLSAETAELCMRAGQGVAGRVLETRQVCSVEDYVKSDVISHDFFDLARMERVRSALAAPLIAHDTVIGVLEVWRRKPSKFTPQHTAELVTLANLASLAIETVRLAEARESVVRELADANRELRTRYDIIRKSATLQEDLVSLLLEGRDLSAITERAQEHLGLPVIVFDHRFNVEAVSPPGACPPNLLADIRRRLRRSRGVDTRLTIEPSRHRYIASQPVTAGVERLGWVVIAGDRVPDETVQLAVTQVCITVALHHAKQSAAARARSEDQASLLWDLLEAPDHARRLALERARGIDIDLGGSHCVLACRIRRLHPDEDAGAPAGIEECDRQEIAKLITALPSASRLVKLAALRNDILGILCTFDKLDRIRALANGLAAQFARWGPNLSISIGISMPVADPMAVASAYKEACIAAEVARQRSKPGIVAYEDVGVAGLLMGSREDADILNFVRGTLGPLLGEPTKQTQTLLNSLRVFFAADCSRRRAAAQLRIHHKTLCYRLEKIAQLTRLDLCRHEDRMVADLALKMADMLGSKDPLSSSLPPPVGRYRIGIGGIG